MAKRPRSHQLEDESWKALNNSIPSHWVLRKPQPDYGIDGEVEIFDSSGSSTGLMFFVQLKGTDTIDKRKVLSCRFSLETLAYYKSLQLPVLLVRYHSPSEALYIRWAYGIDPYYTRKGSKSIKVEFSEESRWTEQTPALLTEDLKIFRRFRDPGIPLPIKFRFDFPEKEVFSVPIGIVESLIRDAANSVSEVISFTSEPSGSSVPRIRITNDLILVDLVGLISFNLHLKKRYPKEIITTHLPHDILVGIALVLHRLGHHNIAADIAYQHILSSSLLGNYEIAFEIVSCFALGRRVDMAIEVSEQILDRGEDDQSLYVIFALPAFRKVKMTDTEFKSFKRLLLKAVDKAKESGFWKGAGSCHYNLGNRMRGGSWENDREAFHHYRMAAKYDPSYKKRDYFWSEVAGILFHLEKFGYSERFYNKALELGVAPDCMALRADSLMFAGKYKEAHDLFKEHARAVDKVDGEWTLKSWVLGGLMKILDLEAQIRHPNQATKLADVKDLSPEKSEKRLDQALELDALCGLAWFNRGVEKASSNNYCEALVSFLIAGLVQLNDIEAWSNVLVCVFNCPEYTILTPSVLSVAYRINSENFVRRFAQIIEGQPEKSIPGWLKREIINLISEYAREFGKYERPIPILRLINPDGTYSVIDPNVEPTEEELKEVPFPEFPERLVHKSLE